MTIAEYLAAGGWTEGEAVALLAAATWLVVGGGALLVWWWRRRRRRRAHEGEAGAPEDDFLDDTQPLEPSLSSPGALIQCPHGVSLARPCERCLDVLRGKHVLITLDDDDETPKDPPS